MPQPLTHFSPRTEQNLKQIKVPFVPQSRSPSEVLPRSPQSPPPAPPSGPPLFTRASAPCPVPAVHGLVPRGARRRSRSSLRPLPAQ